MFQDIPWGLVTVIVGFIGCILAVRRANMFRIEREITAVNLSNVFYSDAGLYLMTTLFGALSFGSADLDFLLYPMRIILMVINTYFGYRLIRRW